MLSQKEVVRKLLRRWTANWELSQLYPSALRRVRTLRADGYNVKKKRLIKNGKITNTWLYKI